MERIIRHRYTHATAIEKIEIVYVRGRGASITAILRQIRLDGRQGGHAELQNH